MHHKCGGGTWGHQECARRLDRTRAVIQRLIITSENSTGVMACSTEGHEVADCWLSASSCSHAWAGGSGNAAGRGAECRENGRRHPPTAQ
eukprot:4389408-Prymnesium_polylepis.1